MRAPSLKSASGVGEWSFWFLWPREHEKDVAVFPAIEAYGDESGIDTPDFCVVLGVVGSTKQWRVAESDWRSVCKGQVFHAKDFFARDSQGRRVSPYADWSDKQAREFLAGLFDAISVPRLRVVGCLVHTKVFNALSLGERKYLTGAVIDPDLVVWRDTGSPNRPWFLGFGHLLVRIAQATKPGLKVHLWFDRQKTFAPLAHEVYTRATGPTALPILQSRLGGLIFEAKDNYPGIQAADLIAYSGFAYVNSGKRYKHDDHAYAIRRIDQMRPHPKVWEFDKARMERHLAMAPPELREKWDAAKLKGRKKR